MDSCGMTGGQLRHDGWAATIIPIMAHVVQAVYGLRHIFQGFFVYPAIYVTLPP
jgi:hypothetical protein